MVNRSHSNAGHIGMNLLKKRGVAQASVQGVSKKEVELTYHSVVTADCLDCLRRIPDGTIQLIVCDPPYNIQMAHWDQHEEHPHHQFLLLHLRHDPLSLALWREILSPHETGIAPHVRHEG